jgi:hypothetical protein
VSYLICRFDYWLRHSVVKPVLRWLYEWLSISQKTVELSLICVYVVSSVGMVSYAMQTDVKVPIAVWVICQILMVRIMISYHRDSDQNRAAKHLNGFACILRFFWVVITAIVAMPPYGYGLHRLSAVSMTVGDAGFMIFLFVVATNCGGERGRKRKLALAKLKELFSWLPDPQPHEV